MFLSPSPHYRVTESPRSIAPDLPCPTWDGTARHAVTHMINPIGSALTPIESPCRPQHRKGSNPHRVASPPPHLALRLERVAHEKRLGGVLHHQGQQDGAPDRLGAHGPKLAAGSLKQKQKITKQKHCRALGNEDTKCTRWEISKTSSTAAVCPRPRFTGFKLLCYAMLCPMDAFFCQSSPLLQQALSYLAVLTLWEPLSLDTTSS